MLMFPNKRTKKEPIRGNPNQKEPEPEGTRTKGNHKSEFEPLGTRTRGRRNQESEPDIRGRGNQRKQGTKTKGNWELGPRKME